MLKKLLEGLVFGAGFAFAFAVIWTIWSVGMTYLMPRVIESSLSTTKEPEFRKPVEAQVATPSPGSVPEKQEFNFFKHSGVRMQIPEGGGILSMSPMTTPKGAKRPSTYQLWMTESKLWQIRTIEEKVEIEELPYPKNASVKDLDGLMRANLGLSSRQSTMTVSSYEMGRLKSSGESSRDDTLNGKMKISVEGVVFVQPNPF